MTTHRFNLTPVPKPRQTQADRWKQRPAVIRYRTFADDLRAQASSRDLTFPESGASVEFILPMPKSW